MAKSKKKAVSKPVKKTAPKKPAAKKLSKPSSKKSKNASQKVKSNSKQMVKPAKASKTSKSPVKSALKVGQGKAPQKKEVKPVTKLQTKVKGHPVVKPITKQSIPPTKKKVQEMRTRYSDAELEEFRLLIIDKLDAARKELRYLQEQINRTSDNGTDDTENKFASSDDGSSSMEREYLNQMAARQILYIDHLDKALVRIQNKTYGICRVTGKLIEKERLRAVPHATLSMEAKLTQHS